VNFDNIAQLQKADRWDEAVRYLGDAAKGLERAGADCVMICAVTMHLVADAVAGAVNIPFIHIIDETARCLVDAGCHKPLLIATRYTMEQGFYQERMSRHGIDVLVPFNLPP
jgi:aspartate racemase